MLRSRRAGLRRQPAQALREVAEAPDGLALDPLEGALGAVLVELCALEQDLGAQTSQL
eukprot:COSAG05_NODE_195_length_14550_cov_203.233686_14_plen_58_part_00